MANDVIAGYVKLTLDYQVLELVCGIRNNPWIDSQSNPTYNIDNIHKGRYFYEKNHFTFIRVRNDTFACSLWR